MKENEKLKKAVKKLSFLTDDFFAKFIGGWLFASAVYLLIGYSYPLDVSFADRVSIIGFLLLVTAFIFLMSVVDRKLPSVALCVSLFLFSLLLLCRMNSMYVYLPLAVFFALSVKYMCAKTSALSFNMHKYTLIAFVCLVTVFFAHITPTITVLRYKTFSAPNYDFGIFCNMYYHMKKTLLPVVSSERDRLLSHFAVHISPILYALLPIYAVFTSPVTIAVCQVLVIYSGIIPIYLIAKKYDLSSGMISAIAVTFAAYPALCANCMFDFHENCFLTPLILWMIYFSEKGKTIPMFLFAVLTLMVKEDAAVYVAVFGAYLLISEKKYRNGAILIVGATVYFITACTILQKYGDGIMSIRYANLINGDDGLFGIIKTLLMNPGYAISEIFTTTEDTFDKIIYFIQLFIPLWFVPFFTKKFSRCILILPVLLNLLTDFVYQYDISFQYSFGISAFLLYLFVINSADATGEKRRRFALTAAGLSCLLFIMMFIPKYISYNQLYTRDKELFKQMDEVLSEIPEDKSVTASAFIVTHTTERNEVYEIEYHNEINTDYLVLDMRPGYSSKSDGFASKYKDAGYVLVKEVENGIAVYASPEEAAFYE